MAPGRELVAQTQAAMMDLQLGTSGLSLLSLAEVFVKSGFFKDAEDVSQAVVKILYGQEIGLSPIQSMLSVHMVEGKPELAAVTMGMKVRQSGRYDYRVLEHTREACEIEFYTVNPDGTRGEAIGTSRWDQTDTDLAGLNKERSNHQKFPKAMKFARAMSQGVKWHCLDAVGGVPVYHEGELSDDQDRPAKARDVTPPKQEQERGTLPEGDPLAPKRKAAKVASPDLTDELRQSIEQAKERKAQKEEGLANPAAVPCPTPSLDGYRCELAKDHQGGHLYSFPAPAEGDDPALEEVLRAEPESPGAGSEAPAEPAQADGQASLLDLVSQEQEQAPANQATRPTVGVTCEKHEVDPGVYEAEDATATCAKCHRLVYRIGPQKFGTMGITRAQMLECFKLFPALERKVKGLGHKLREEVAPGSGSGDNLTAAQATEFIARMKAALPAKR